MELLGEASVRAGVIEAGAEDLDALRVVFVDQVPEPGTFGRSAGRVGLREKPEHDFSAAEIAQLHALAAVIVDFEIWSGIADLQHRWTSEQCLPRVSQRASERHAAIVMGSELQLCFCYAG